MDVRKTTASCFTRRLKDCGRSLSENSKENLKEIKEARNRCQEAGKHNFDSKTDLVSSHPIRGNTSSPGKVRAHSGNAFSPGKVRGQLDSRSSKHASQHCPSSSTSDSQILKTSFMSSPLKTRSSLQKQSKNKTMSFNKGEACTEQGSLGKRGIHGEEFRLGANKSDCESFSSSESVSINKLHDQSGHGRKVLTGNAKNRQDGVHFVDSLSIQKKKAKTCALGHMQSSLDLDTSILPKTKQLFSQPHSRPCDKRTTCYGEKQEKVCRNLKPIKRDTEKTTDTTNTSCTVNTSDFQMLAENYEMSKPGIELYVPIVKLSEFVNVEHKIYTHTSDQSLLSSPIGGSSTILKNRTISNTPPVNISRKENNDVTNIHSDEQLSEKSECKLLDTENNVGFVEQPRLEVDYISSLQSMFLKSKMKKSYPGMESGAIAQDLWHLLESKKEDCDSKESEIAGSERLNSLGIILDKATLNLECLSLLNRQVDEDLTELSPVTDMMQHLPITGALFPQQDEKETDLYSEKLDRALRESEHLLAELGLLTGDKLCSSSTQVLDSAQDLARNMSAGHRDLRECQKDLNLFMA